MTEHQLSEFEDRTERPTPADIVEQAVSDGRIVVEGGDVAEALQQVIAAARRGSELSDRLELDPLTMTFNAEGFNRRLEEAMELVRNGNRATDPVAAVVIMLDADGFKEVNDSRGHAKGDDLLWEIGGRLWLAVRAEDTVARRSGDEFALLLLVTRGEGETVRDDAIAVLRGVDSRLARIIGEHNASEPHPILHIHLSAGAAIFEKGDTIDSKELVDRADKAMYAGKRHGKGGSVLFEERVEPRLNGIRRRFGELLLNIHGTRPRKRRGR